MSKEYRNISELTLWDKNPRSIDKKGFARLLNQLKRVKEITGEYLYKPLLVTSNNVVIGGNMRLRALQELGEVSVWVSVVNTKNEQEMIEVALSDNDQAGKTEKDLLLSLIEDYPEIALSDYAVSFDTPTTLKDFMSQFEEVEEDEAPEVDETQPAKSELGKVYQLGRHRLMCGDATKIEDVEKLMDGQKADMVFTDPPYGVDYSGGIQFTDEGVKTEQRERLIADDTTQIIADSIPVMALFCNGPIYTWFADTKAKDLYNAVEKVGEIHALIIWVKNGGYAAMNAQYKQRHEPCLYWKAKGKSLKWAGNSMENTVWEINKDGINKFHPTQKPVSLSARAIKNHDAKSVLDLFGGSGSTLIACEQTNRTCYMMELDPRYCDVIRKRYAKFIGEEARWEEITPEV